MCDIPVAVSNEETVVRALRDCHVTKGRAKRLKENVFRGLPGTDEVSVMRHTFVGSDFCKNKAKEIAGPDPNNPYVGFAAITVKAVRSVGSEVTDSREEFCGHAHISHGIIVPAEEPPDPVFSLLLGIRVRKLIDKARLVLDPEPNANTWTGEQIEIPAV
jgi:hypothetical protein